MDLEAVIRGVKEALGRGRHAVTADPYGALAVSQLLPAYAQLCAAGKVFGFDMSAGTAKAPVTAMPTTSPEWGIYNANPGGGPHLVLLLVSVISESGTMGLGLTIVGTSAKGPQTAVSANYASAIVSCLDGSQKVPNAFITNNPTLVGGTPAWVALAALDQVSAIAVGTGVVARVDGLIIAPPQGMIGLEVLAPVGSTALFDLQCIVAEVQL